MTMDFLSTRPYKGTRDFYPEDMSVRNWYFGRMREVVERYGYEEYGGPIVEPFDLYAAKSGNELVEEQVYHFMDRGERRLAIRPEMTPTVARMVAARMGEMVFPLRWYTIANLMRYERPQKGRLREHWQLNVDVFGDTSVRSDLEILAIVADLMQAFGADGSMFRIRVSHRVFFNDVLRQLLGVGDHEIHLVSKAIDKRSKISREEYEQWLGESGLDAEKITGLDEICAAPFVELVRRLQEPSAGARHLQALFALCEQTGLLPFVDFDLSIVRGFDYYTGTVFEVYDNSPENRRALFGGGRYDDLVGLFRRSDISGIGFGFGDVTFQDFLEVHHLTPKDLTNPEQVFIATFEDVPFAEYMRLAADFRAVGLAAVVHLDTDAKIKKQLAYAERKRFPVVAILGGQELEQGVVILKHMERRSQETISRAHCVEVATRWMRETRHENERADPGLIRTEKPS